MKIYKKDDFNFYIYKSKEFIKSKYYKEINYKEIKNKNNINYIIILKKKKPVGFLYGCKYKGFTTYYHNLNIRTQKDYLIILDKLYKIYKEFDITIKINKKNDVFIKLIKKLDYTNWDYVISPNRTIWLYTHKMEKK